MRGSLEVAGIGVLAVGFGWFAVGTGINLTAAENTGIITGAVTSTNGREAGVWVIAESDDFDTKFRKIVVTNDEGNFLLPELPAASYHVWVHIPAYLGISRILFFVRGHQGGGSTKQYAHISADYKALAALLKQERTG